MPYYMDTVQSRLPTIRKALLLLRSDCDMVSDGGSASMESRIGRVSTVCAGTAGAAQFQQLVASAPVSFAEFAAALRNPNVSDAQLTQLAYQAFGRAGIPGSDDLARWLTEAKAHATSQGYDEAANTRIINVLHFLAELLHFEIKWLKEALGEGSLLHQFLGVHAPFDGAVRDFSIEEDKVRKRTDPLSLHTVAALIRGYLIPAVAAKGGQYSDLSPRQLEVSARLLQSENYRDITLRWALASLVVFHADIDDADFHPALGTRITEHTLSIPSPVEHGIPTEDAVYGAPFLPYISHCLPDAFWPTVVLQFTAVGLACEAANYQRLPTAAVTYLQHGSSWTLYAPDRPIMGDMQASAALQAAQQQLVQQQQ